MAVVQLPLTPQCIDEVLGRIETAYSQVNDSKNSVVGLPKAELDLLSQLEVARDFMMAVLRNSDRAILTGLFGGDCSRISRIRTVLDTVELSEMNAEDQRWQTCRSACASVEQVLEDLGLGWALRKAQAEEREHLAQQNRLGRNSLQDAPGSPQSTEAVADKGVIVIGDAVPGGEPVAATAKRAPVMVVSIATDSEADWEDSGEDSDLSPLESAGRRSSNAARQEFDLSLLPQNGSVQRPLMYRPPRRTTAAKSGEDEEDSTAMPYIDLDAVLEHKDVEPHGDAVHRYAQQDLEPHEDACVHHVVAGLVAENRAIELDRSGRTKRATKQYGRCAWHLAIAIRAAEPAHSSDKPRLESHYQEVLARIKYLRSLGPVGRPPPVSVEERIKPVSLDMQVPEIQIVKAGDATPVSPANDWKTFAACAALGAAGGFLVLGGAAAALSAASVVSAASSSAVGTTGAFGSLAGAAAGAHCSNRKDALGSAARRAGSRTAKHVGRAAEAASEVDSKYGLSQLVTNGFDAVSTCATAKAKEVYGAWKTSPSSSATLHQASDAMHADDELLRSSVPVKDVGRGLAEVPGATVQDAGGKRGGRRRASSSATAMTAKPRKKHSRSTGQDDGVAGGVVGETSAGTVAHLFSINSLRLSNVDAAESQADTEAVNAVRLSADRACLRGNSRRRPKRRDSSAAGNKPRRAHSSAATVGMPASDLTLPLPPAATLLTMPASQEQDAAQPSSTSACSVDVHAPGAALAVAGSSNAGVDAATASSSSASVAHSSGSRSSKRRPSRSTIAPAHDTFRDRHSVSKAITSSSFARSSPMTTSFDFEKLDAEWFPSSDGVEVNTNTAEQVQRRRRPSSAAGTGKGRRSTKKQSSPRSSQSTAAPSSDTSAANESFL